MTHDVSQWLTEIKTLRQQLVDAQQDREQAYSSAANWQRLYETEAQQRRTEANLARQTIAELKQEIQQLKGLASVAAAQAADSTAIRAEVEKLQTIAELQDKLIESLVVRDQLTQALQTEQTNHAQTRQGLTTALGDAIDMLSKDKAQG
jgi:predicted RNase H-like nuclease (RuvC/YqgF family)